MAGSDDEEASEPSEDEPAATEEHPPPWWRPVPAAEAAPDPALPAVSEALQRADLLVLVAGEVPPRLGHGALRSFADWAAMYVLLVPTAGQWLERGWPAKKVVEIEPLEAATLEQDRAAELQESIMQAFVGGVTSLCRNMPSTVETNLVCLDIAGVEALPSVRQGIRSLLASVPGSLLVTLGPEAPGPEGEGQTVERHLCAGSLGASAALQWLERDLARVEMATFQIVDTPATSKAVNGAEVSMPRDSSCLRCYRKAITAFDSEDDAFQLMLFAAPPVFTQSIYNSTMFRQLELSQSVPWQFFSQTADGMPLVARLVVGGVWFPDRNERLEKRRQTCLGILQEMIAKFGKEDYQARLNKVRDQCELRAMVKAVHLTILPKLGFPLTANSGFTESMHWQTRMQAFLFSGLLLEQDMRMGDLSLYLSGVLKLSSLPPRCKEKAEGSVEPARTPDAASAGPPAPAGSSLFKSHMPPVQSLFGGWFGWRRVPTFFLYSSADEMADYLRADPDGPFSGRLDDWPLTGQPPPQRTRWQRWGFTEDAKEAILKTDWHALPNSCGDFAELFVPRKGRRDVVCGAPPRFVAFAEAFRLANRGCWMKLAKALKTMQTSHQEVWKQRGGSDLVDELVKSLTSHGLFGIIEAQVWWGDGSVVLPSHKDGATSLLHLSLTLGGVRTLRVGLFRSMLAGGEESRFASTERFMNDPEDPEAGKKPEDVWDEAGWQILTVAQGILDDVRMVRGSAYLSSPYCFEHGVRYEAGSQEEPVIALQCRFAFEPSLGKKLNGRRDSVMWDISNAIAKTLVTAAENGELRMPSVEEVKQMQQWLSGNRNAFSVLTPVVIEAPPPQPQPPLQPPPPAPAPAPAPAPTAAPAAAAPPARGAEPPAGPAAAAPAAAPAVAAAAPAPLPPAPVAAPPKERPAESERQPPAAPKEPPPPPTPGPPSMLLDRNKEKQLAKKDEAFRKAAKERERLRECKQKLAFERQERAKGLQAAVLCAEEVQILIRHGQKDGSIVVTVPGSATMLEVKKALVQKIGRGLVRKVQLVKEKGNTFEPYRDQEQLGDRRELVMLGLAL